MTARDSIVESMLARRVLARIRDERLSPRPRWQLALRNYVFWSVGALSVFLGSLAVSAMLAEIVHGSWRAAPSEYQFFRFFIAAVPVSWLVAFACFIAIGYASIRATRHGYRYPLATLALGSILASMVLGIGLYAAGLGAWFRALVS